MQGRVENKIITEGKISEHIDAIENNDIKELVNRFYFSISSKTHLTKKRYIQNVLRFIEANNIDSLEKIRNIDSYAIQQYVYSINYYKKNGETHELSPATIACIYSSLSAFFTFLSRTYIIDRNPFENKCIERPKIQEGEITFLTPEEVRKVEDAIMNGVGSNVSKAKQEEWKYRDLLLFRIPAITGLRVTALSEINVEDINFDNCSIRVTDKGNRTKDIYLDRTTINYIETWLYDRMDLLDRVDTECNALFISNQRKRMNVNTISAIIKKYTEAVVDKHITPHKLRSTCGTNLYQANHDIYLVAEVLGHKSTEPTKRYTKVFDTDKRNAANLMGNIYNKGE